MTFLPGLFVLALIFGVTWFTGGDPYGAMIAFLVIATCSKESRKDER